MFLQVVMTPVIFVSFLFSLAWVDFRYSLMRSHSHSETPSRMPHWLHRLLYRESPYQYVRVNAISPAAIAPSEKDEGQRWHYHTKQRKLMKMEVDDAFHIRGSVLVVLGLVVAIGTLVTWRIASVAWTTLKARLG